MAFNWRDYVDVEDGPNADAIKKSLDEMAATPEGRDAMKKAAENLRKGEGGPDAKVVFKHSDDGMTAAYKDGTVAIGDDESIGRAMGKDGKFYDMSMQSMVFHEIAHYATGGESPANERPTIEMTNAYMKKYYGEPERDPDAHGWLDPSKIDIDGTDGWDWNPNFDESGKHASEILPLKSYAGSGLSVIDQFKTIDQGISEKLSPEMQSLWQVRDHSRVFEKQLRNVLSETDKDDLKTGIKDFHEIVERQYDEQPDIKNEIGPYMHTPGDRNIPIPPPSP